MKLTTDGILIIEMPNLDHLRVRKMKLKLISFSTNLCTMGKLYADDELICSTFELPDRNNNVNVSCIPAGEYPLKMIVSPKYGPCYKVHDVPGRTDILIHTGNTTDDTLGCIMPCSSFGILNGKIAGLSSRVAYIRLKAVLAGENHTLTIERY
jgi:hypothetical protein